jgi:hypothetical protein
MTRFPTNNPNERWGGPSDLEPIQIEETPGSDNPEASTPQVESPRDVSAQPEIMRTSGREITPNALFDLITIYDDEESSEVSLVTPVKIAEETKPEKASTLGPDAPSQSISQNEKNVESGLHDEPLDTLVIPIDISRDELGLGKQGEEISQQEIRISMADYRVSTEPAPDSSILVSNLPPDEKKLEAEPSGHT